MSVRDQDVAAARAAARELDRAVATLRRHFGDTVDVRRLAADAERIPADLDLLCGAEPAVTAPPSLEVIPDREYPADFWQDADDEGVGPVHR